MVLKTKVRVSQSKRAYTQYISIPSAVVQDSQYNIKGDEELNLVVEPTLNWIIISREDLTILPRENNSFEVRPDGILVKTGYQDLRAVFIVRQKPGV